MISSQVMRLGPSRPVWGAWIEIAVPPPMPTREPRRAPYGARGLKYADKKLLLGEQIGRAPYGARGLKYYPWQGVRRLQGVAPRMGRVD